MQNLSPYFVVLYNRIVVCDNKIFSGEFKNWVYEKSIDRTFIGQVIDGVKSGFGELVTPDLKYLGNFDQNHFSGRGKIIVNKVETKGNFVLSKLKGGITKIEGERKKKFYLDDNHELDYSKYTTNKFTQAQGTNEPLIKNLKKKEKNGINWLELPSGNKTPVLENIPWYKLDSILAVNSNSQSLISHPGQKLEKKVVLFENGEKYNGLLLNNQFSGFGKYFYSNGMVYIGEFEKGQRHGIGTMFKDSKKIVTGQWAKNLLHGQAHIYENSNKLSCFFINGKPTSVVTNTQLT